MYLAIDIGGTKTLLGVYSETGDLQSREKIKTDHNYDAFIGSIKKYYSNVTDDIKKCVVGVPGRVNREKGIVYALGNIPWENKSIADDISAGLDGAPVRIENDARLAGLAEAKALGSAYHRVLYLTISTGIGGALIASGKIVKELEDTEPGHMPLLHNGAVISWENLASGRSVVENYGIKAAEITDPAMWAEIGTKIAYGVGPLCAAFQPAAIVFGGGVGQYADKFTPVIKEYLKQNLHPVVIQPSVLCGPQFAEDNVLQGCYELAAQD